MLHRFVLIAVLCGAASAAQAGRIMIAPPPPRMMVDEPGAEPVQLQQLTIRSELSGGMAETTVRMVFFNPNRRQLEGNLQFPLADGQQITAFSLDINGVMRAAVPVDKERGRTVFEAIERRQVDPGLLEVTQGNNFKLRVYPIMPHATRTVELSYSEPLARRGANWVYRLPLSYGDVRNLDLKVRVNDADAQPTVGGIGPGLQFAASGNGHEASFRRERFKAGTAIEVLTKAHADPRVYRQEVGDSTWFVAEVPVKSVRTARPAPRVVGLLWDSSGSGASRAINAELAELGTYLRALGTVEVRLTRLRDRPQAQQIFKIESGDWHSLRRALETTTYDGATALNDWTPERSVDTYLLFSDGLSNYGGRQFPALAAHQKLFALNSSLSADSGRLAALSERYRGQLIAVNAASPGAAAQALLFQDARIDDIAATGAADIEVDSHTVRDGMVRIAGRLVAPEAQLALTLSNGGRQVRMTVPLSARAAHHPRAGATWAAFRLRALEADFELHRSETGRIGRRFGIPTRETSLIVLELIDDYVRYEIEPPAAMLAEYKRHRNAMTSRLLQERGKHFDSVVRMFEERKAWWNTPFDKPPRKPQGTADDHKTGQAFIAAEERSRNDDMAMQQQRVTVTGSSIRQAPQAQTVIANSTSVRAAHPPPPPPPSSPPSSPSPSPAPAQKSATGASAANGAIGVRLKKWTADAPYIERLKKAAPSRLYQVYLDQKPDYADSSAFFLDAADMLFQRGERELALRVLSNLSEMDLENRAILRILGYRLLQAGAPQLAVPVFEQVRRIAAEEPQSFRDLGLALAAAGRAQEAIDTMYEVVLRPWDQRFPDIETITLAEINALVATSGKRLDTSRIDRRLLANLPLDMRVVLTWDADNSDMDLYVTDPFGEKAFYAHSLTEQGGRMSRDFTGGYGPEEFALRKAAPGKYKVEANFYGNRQQVIAGATTLQVKLFSGFGTRRQKEQLVTLRLKDRSETVFVGEFDVK